jgi:hypothetical protein
VLGILILAGCSEDTSGPATETAYVDLITIISRPLAPAPGEETTLMVQDNGESSAGKWAKYYWEVEAGTLQADEGLSVTWKAPDSACVCSVSVRGTIDQSSERKSKKIMVRNYRAENTGMRVSLHPIILGSNELLFFIGSTRSPSAEDFPGYHVYLFAGSASCRTSCSTLDGGDFFTFMGENILASMYSRNATAYRQKPSNVYIFPLFIGTTVNVSNDTEYPKYNRKNQHRYPTATKNLNLVVWQENRVGDRRDGLDDEINIVARKRDSAFSPFGDKIYLTSNVDSSLQDTSMVYNYWNNIKPLITPEEDVVLFFRDTTRTFEPCVVPIVGGLPDPEQFRVLKTGTTGLFEAAKVKVSEETVFQWNPTGNILGFIDGSGYLCGLFTEGDPSSWFVEKADDIGKVYEFIWSADGTMAAVVKDEGVSLVTPAGNEQVIFTKERLGDEIIGLNWSPDAADQKLGFRVVRKGATALESFSAIVVYSMSDDEWYYAIPGISWDDTREPPVDYTWMRMIFESDNDGIYAPVPVANKSGKEVEIYYTYK